MQGENVDRNIDYLCDLVERTECLKLALSEMPSYLYEFLVTRIDTSMLDEELNSKLLSILEIIYDYRLIMDEEECQENLGI